jgi:hypothetical protein
MHFGSGGVCDEPARVRDLWGMLFRRAAVQSYRLNEPAQAGDVKARR